MPGSVRYLCAATAALLFFYSAIAGAWNECRYTRDLDREIDARGVESLKIDAGAGLLRVSGRKNQKTIEVRARACATDENMLDEVDWAIEKRGNRAAMSVDLPYHDDDHWARLDLVVTVPAGLDLDIDDSSGSIRIDNVGAVRLDDGSGSIEIDGVAGPLRINDSSGSITIDNVQGSVDLDDSSGSIDIADVSGDVAISDSSGSINARHVRGTVDVRRDSSGGISVADVGGDFIVRRDGSGGISYRRVAGNIDIPMRD
ncbi:MAG: DUF4097 family beta strand repeat protein [Gammaproteobacteria bacterium]|nr:DUF4097 family beta strand repeat protein [Gammaproteobacteria bacterium]NND61058.1 DUF4097 family beta strand repeat protein [Gammaproteobacteria bacterium]